MSISAKAANKKNAVITVILVIVLLVGLSVMLYPLVSDFFNDLNQKKAIRLYQDAVEQLSDEEYENLIAEAREYNKALAEIYDPLANYSELDGRFNYSEILDITGTGIMGYISIPQISVELPIYHGTSEGVLNVAVGHFQGSSLPVSGDSVHAVISAHRGLPSAKLFSDLDDLVEGDRFTITVLNEVYTYEVDQITIVLPTELDDLAIIDGENYVTLSTCTPYGVNTHRLLVRAKMIETTINEDGETVPVTTNLSADAVQIDTLTVVPFIAAPFVIVLLVYWFFGSGKKKFPYDNPLSALPAASADNNHDKDEGG